MIHEFNILGVDIVSESKDNIINYISKNFDKLRGNYFCLTNTHALVTAVESKQYMKVQQSSVFSLPDGAPIAKYINNKSNYRCERFSGPDFFEAMLKIINEKKIKMFIYGNTEDNLKKVEDKLLTEYPDINFYPFQCSKFRDLSELEKKELIREINENSVDIVFVSLGCPKQEYFCYELSEKTNALWIPIGGAINVYSGCISRAPLWMQTHSLEWLYRLYKEPRRLFKRYLIYNTKYMWLINRWNNEK